MIKTTLILLALVLFWGGCGYIAHGHSLGYDTAMWPYFPHNRFDTQWSYLGGPFAAIIVEMGPEKRYWRTEPLTKGEMWLAWQMEFGIDYDQKGFEHEYEYFR